MICFDSGRIKGSLPFIVPKFSVKSKTGYQYVVMVRDQTGGIARSEPECLETGLLYPEDFYGKWITADTDAPIFRKKFFCPRM